MSVEQRIRLRQAIQDAYDLGQIIASIPSGERQKEASLAAANLHNKLQDIPGVDEH